MSTREPTSNGKPVMRVRFEVDIEECEEDYRPVSWPIAHPYWCTGESDTSFILVAYVESEEQLLALWPEASSIDIMQENLTEYTYTDRFSKPDYL